MPLDSAYLAAALSAVRGKTRTLERMKRLRLFGRVVGSVWLVHAAFATSVLAAIGFPYGPNIPALLFLATAFLCLGGTVMLWRASRIHWVTIAALAVSVGLFVYGHVAQ